MKIAILDCATLIDPTLVKYHSIGALVRAWLVPHLPEAEFRIIPIAHGAALPGLDDHDGFLLPGSECGVYDETPWMEPLAEYLRCLRTAAKPVMGICFGHQMMAQTFGGRACQAGLGMCAGARQFSIANRKIDAHVLHQDQVIEVPPGARVTGGADYCPNGVIEYGFPAMSIQFHPEYPTSFVADVIDILEGDMLEPADAAAARASLSSPVDGALFAQETAAFYRRQLAGRRTHLWH